MASMRLSLQKVLNECNPGSLADPRLLDRIERYLARCWDDFEGFDETNMDGHKLPGRMVHAKWQPPILEFEIERHRIDGQYWRGFPVYLWIIDVELGTKTCEYRRRKPHRSGGVLDLKALAKKVAGLLNKSRDHEWITWSTDRSQVTLHLGSIIREDHSHSVRQGRRKRFRKVVADLLKRSGWREVPESRRLRFTRGPSGPG